jgi:hypothetical protein
VGKFLKWRKATIQGNLLAMSRLLYFLELCGLDREVAVLVEKLASLSQSPAYFI